MLFLDCSDALQLGLRSLGMLLSIQLLGGRHPFSLEPGRKTHPIVSVVLHRFLSVRFG
jgi:hypothetical protein